MSRVLKLLAAAVVAGGMMAAVPQVAHAQHHWHGGWHGGGWHHGGWGGWGPGFALGLGWGYGPYYGGPYYYGPRAYGPDCGWIRQRYWYRGRWHLRRVWRCW